MEAVSPPLREREPSRLHPDVGAPGLLYAVREAGDSPAARPVRVLVVDDDRALRESCTGLLAGDGHDVASCRGGEEALAQLKRRQVDIILLDLQASGGAWMELLDAVRACSPASIVIATSARPSVPESVAALDAGAWDYVPKPFSAAHLQLLIGRAALGLSDLLDEPAADGEAPDAANPVTAVLGASPSVVEVIRLARRVAATDASVFITGESGTGKDRMAEFIHRRSHRRNGPLVPINCAAIPEGLLETEMFGHRKGAFTGAVEDRAGLLEGAHRGTLVLDELTQMPLGTQAKLLRVIQDGVVRRVGSNAVNAIVDVRFIAVTNESPEEAIRSGRLREDLYYRLRVFPLHLPPLRERREDIPLLAGHFLRLSWRRHRRHGSVPQLSDEALRALTEHPWRGNIRELQNVIEHGVVLFEPGMMIRPRDIPFAVHAEAPHDARRPGESFSDAEASERGFHDCRESVMAEFERSYVQWLMSHTRGNLSKAPRIAGIQRTTLYRPMEKHGFRRAIPLAAAP